MNIMRVAKLFFVLGMLCSLLMSCEERPRIYTREDFIDRALELATFLTNNYIEKGSQDFDIAGDSILFKIETGDTITYVITENYIEELVFVDAWEPGEPWDTTHNGFMLNTALKDKNSEHSFGVTLHHGLQMPSWEKHDTVTYAVLFSMNRASAYDVVTEASTPYEWKETEDTIFITSANMTCTLKKNVGIVKFTCDEHSWELVQ